MTQPQRLRGPRPAGARALGSIAAAIAAAVSVAACGSSESDPGVATARVPTSTVVAADAATPAALRFSAPLVGGGDFDGASVVGTPAAFWFWAPT